jgi:hypothetical protein
LVGGPLEFIAIFEMRIDEKAADLSRDGLNYPAARSYLFVNLPGRFS